MDSLSVFLLKNWMLLAPCGVSLFLYFCALLFVVLYVVYFRRRARIAAWNQRDSSSNDDSLPWVSVLKPLCGSDSDLEQNLTSFARLDYHRLEIICRSENPFDPALSTARRVAAKFPQVRFRILAGAGSQFSGAAAINPKVAQLEAMSTIARGDLLLLSDSNVRIGAMDLRALVLQVDHPSIGLLYQPFFGEGEATLGAAVENLRNTEFPGMLCIGARLFARQPVVTAKGILLRRAALRSIGGFSTLVEYHNDDHLLAMAVKRQGWRLRLAAIPAREVQKQRSLRETVQRHARHAAGRWRTCSLACGLELLFSPLLLSLPLLALGTTGAALFTAVALAKFVVELVAGRLLRGTWLSPQFWLAMPLKDLLMPVMLVKGLFVNRVTWRGVIYRMGRSSRLVPIPASPSSNSAKDSRPSRDAA